MSIRTTSSAPLNEIARSAPNSRSASSMRSPGSRAAYSAARAGMRCGSRGIPRASTGDDGVATLPSAPRAEGSTERRRTILPVLLIHPVLPLFSSVFSYPGTELNRRHADFQTCRGHLQDFGFARFFPEARRDGSRAPEIDDAGEVDEPPRREVPLSRRLIGTGTSSGGAQRSMGRQPRPASSTRPLAMDREPAFRRVRLPEYLLKALTPSSRPRWRPSPRTRDITSISFFRYRISSGSRGSKSLQDAVADRSSRPANTP